MTSKQNGLNALLLLHMCIAVAIANGSKYMFVRVYAIVHFPRNVHDKRIEIDDFTIEILHENELAFAIEMEYQIGLKSE